jgi:hypothetical protein
MVTILFMNIENGESIVPMTEFYGILREITTTGLDLTMRAFKEKRYRWEEVAADRRVA